MLVHFSTLSTTAQPIRILYASQTGTAKLFAHQLSEELSDRYPDRDISIEGWHETNNPEELLTTGPLHVFMTSVAGVGEPPDNGKKFYNWIMNNNPALNGLDYCVFGLGSTAGHMPYYNVIGKNLDKRLEELGASRVLEIGLGDDGDCIEDDFDNWSANLMELLEDTSGVEETGKADEVSVAQDEAQIETSKPTTANERDSPPRIKCPGVALAADETRMISNKYPTLTLIPRKTDVVRHHMFKEDGSIPKSFYSERTIKFDVISNKLAEIDGGESGMNEMEVILNEHSSNKMCNYEAGDHLVIYPVNSQCVVEALLDHLDVDRHAIIGTDGQPVSYPFPTGLTVYETLSHCVDLGALVSPNFARMILQRKDIDYKAEVAHPRRTVLELLFQYQRKLSLEDLLFQIAPMKPRYYSIASSSVKHPTKIRLLYRKIKYVTSLGSLREGVCTSYLSYKGHLGNDVTKKAHLAAYINRNSAFRLPNEAHVPILMIAVGSGVAPIRALVEERVALIESGRRLGSARVFLGFRTPDDQVYKARFEEAIRTGALDDISVTFASGDKDNRLVTDVLLDEGEYIWNHFQSGGVAFLCGGARSFGAAVEDLLLKIFQLHGSLDYSDSEKYLRHLMHEKKIMDDLA
jgi:NADPH-ferrihemoprotein reductase